MRIHVHLVTIALIVTQLKRERERVNCRSVPSISFQFKFQPNDLLRHLGSIAQCMVSWQLQLHIRQADHTSQAQSVEFS